MRLAYIRMLEMAHEESGRRHTIIITQGETAREMIPQQIRPGSTRVRRIDMTIEYSEQKFQAIEASVDRIRARALKARMSAEMVAREDLKEIVMEANILTNLLLDGEIVGQLGERA